MIALISVISTVAIHNNTSTDNAQQNINFREVSIKNTKTAISSASRAKFDLNSVMTGDNGDGFNFNTYKRKHDKLFME